MGAVKRIWAWTELGARSFWDYIDFERLTSMYGRLHFDIYSLAYNDSDAKADADLFNIEWTGGPYA